MVSKKFIDDIKKFNSMYKLDMPASPKVRELKILQGFQDIISEEVKEAEDIFEMYKGKNSDDLSKEERLEILTAVSDWLGDMVVYCFTQAQSWGLPMEDVLNVIMDSNFSKLDQDGNPIYDDRGKVLKGPNYWKPEPKIKEILKRDLKQ
tara:strand:- start:607 stop:1053 length:447 start_codon:yes stop_codon:yes gene_type:complete